MPVKTKHEVKPKPDVTTVKLSREVKDWITDRAQWNESIDNTLRRLLSIGQNGKKK